MKRALALAMIVVGALALALSIAIRPAVATLDDDVFTSREADVRMLAPRGWRVSDQPSYPGVLLWMVRAKPPGQMMLTVEDIGAASRACWPKECGHDATAPDFVCVLANRLGAAGFAVGPVEDGRWFDYQRGKDATRFLRQGVVVLGHHAFTLILSAPTANDRAAHAREFDRALRSVRPLTGGEGAPADERGPPAIADDGGAIAIDAPPDVDAPPIDAAVTGDGQLASAVTPVDAGAPRPDAGVPVVEEVPPCRGP